jgi:hypothetical protein
MTMGRGWARGTAVALLALALALLVAGCSGGSKGNASTTPGVPGGGSTGSSTPENGLSATATVLAQTPTVTPKPGTGGQQGLAEFCAEPPSVAVQLPASIPAYPNAQLRVSQTSGGNGLYGLCTTDGVSTVASYYTAQLPAKGWQQVQSATIQNVQQIMASQGNAQLILTIEPDAQVSGTTQIILLTSGLSG